MGGPESSARKGGASGAAAARAPGTLANLRFQDLTTFLVVRRTASISAAAREEKVTPSQVSKSIASLEARLGVRLFERSIHGIVLSAAGADLAPTIAQAVAGLRVLERPIEVRSPPLTIAAPQYLLAPLLSRIAAHRPAVRLRILELPPAVLRAYARQELFEIALLPSAPERITIPWVGTRVGEMRSALFTTPGTARKLGPAPVDVARLRTVPFVTPAAPPDDRFAAVHDDCPLDVGSRSAGHEAQTIATALRLAAVTGQVVFGPRIAAIDYLASGALVEVPVKGWDVREPLFVACNQDRVLASVRALVVEAATDAFREGGATSRDAGSERDAPPEAPARANGTRRRATTRTP